MRTSAGTSIRARCPSSPTAPRACSGSRPQAAGCREAARRRLGTSCSSTGTETASPTTWASWSRATAPPCAPSKAIRTMRAGEAPTASEALSLWGMGRALSKKSLSILPIKAAPNDAKHRCTRRWLGCRSWTATLCMPHEAYTLQGNNPPH